MAVQLTTEITNLDEVIALYAEMGPAALDQMEIAGMESGLLLEREAKENSPVGVSGAGGLRGSIGSKTARLAAERVDTTVSTPLPYAVPVELGSKPHFPPIEPLVDWVIHKLAKGPDEAEGIALAIARKIAARGTEGQFMFTNAFNDNLEQVQTIHIRRAEQGLAQLGGRA